MYWKDLEVEQENRRKIGDSKFYHSNFINDAYHFNLIDFEVYFCKADLWQKIESNEDFALVVDPFELRFVKLFLLDEKSF